MSTFLGIFIGTETVQEFTGNIEEAESFRTFFSMESMVMIMGHAHGMKIGNPGDLQPFNALVYKNIVHQEVRQSVKRNTQTGKKAPVKAARSDYDEPNRRNGEHETEQVVQFKRAFAWFMVAFVPNPEKAVHDVLVRKPGHAFH